jgi:translation initiation factor IF-2
LSKPTFKINLPTSAPKASPSKGSTSESGQELKTVAEKAKPAAAEKQTGTVKPIVRIKEDSSIASALKHAEKTIAQSKKEKPAEVIVPVRKARIMLSPEEPKVQVIAEAPLEPKIFEQTIEEKTELLPPVAELEKTAPVVELKTQPVTGKPAEVKAPTVEAKQVQSTIQKPQPLLPQAVRKDLKAKKPKEVATFDIRDRRGLVDADNQAWRKRRQFRPQKKIYSEETVRPKTLSIRVPISIKDLAVEMKLKASQLIGKLFQQGKVHTLNDYLDDETVIQLLGMEFGCDISIDTKEEERIRITDSTIREEIAKTSDTKLTLRPPVVTFMGHVDHGKTSLIDSIRKSNRVSQEAGAITQHIGAFKVTTAAGEVTILDTPGHEAFSEMRTRGANVTDIVILVVAGDEGIRAQTEEAIRQARAADVPILVAINKCDKPNFDTERVYRELADRELLPEAWGGSTITVNCSASTGQGIKELLEMIALQAEILELRANPDSRARGTVLESQMIKGLGAVATILVMNGTLRKNDAIVFGSEFGRIKTMQNDAGLNIDKAGPGCPVKITGLSNLALAGSEFVVVKNEKEARDLAEARAEGAVRSAQSQSKLTSLERMMAKRAGSEVKILPLILRADVQGSLEALKSLLLKITSKKVRLEIVHEAVGEVSVSDIELAEASKSTIIRFHTGIENHAAELLKRKKVPMISENVIFKAVDLVKEKMTSLLDTVPEERDIGQAEVLAVFKSSLLGQIAGCKITDGLFKRQCLVRQHREKELVWTGKIASLKRGKDEVKDVKEGFECGILLDGQGDVQVGDIFTAYEIHQLKQDL